MMMGTEELQFPVGISDDLYIKGGLVLVPPGYPHPCPGTCFYGSTHTAAHTFTSDCLLQKYGNKRLVEMGQSTRMMFTHQLPASREATITYRDKVVLHYCPDTFTHDQSTPWPWRNTDL